MSFRHRLSTLSLTALVLSASLLAARSASAYDDKTHFIDILSPEIVGELRSRTYDLDYTVRQDDKSTSLFVGNTSVKGGQFTGGGFGLRGVIGLDHYMRLSFEASIQGGRVLNADLPWNSTSTAWRTELLSGFGWQFPVGALTLHTATIFGVDGMGFKVAGPKDGTQATGAGGGGGMLENGSLAGYSLSRWDLRLGQQVGVHVNVTEWVALYADFTVDYDGQYRARMGIAFGGRK